MYDCMCQGTYCSTLPTFAKCDADCADRVIFINARPTYGAVVFIYSIMRHETSAALFDD